MIQKVENILISIFGWIIGPMVTAILAITIFNYQATIRGNELLNKHLLEQANETKYIVNRIYRDSLAIIEINDYLRFTISVIRESHPELYEKMVAADIEAEKENAILPKKKYLTTTKIIHQ